MNFLNNIFSKTGVAALVAGLGLAPGANALSIEFNLSSTAFVDLIISDGDNDNLISASNQNVGDFAIFIVGASAADHPGESILQQVAFEISGGGGDTLEIVTKSSFSGGADAPNTSIVTYSLGGGSLGGAVEGFGTATDSAGSTSTGVLSFDPGVDGTNDYSGNSSAFTPLSDPFDLISTVTVGTTSGGATTAFTSKVIAAVPLPAAGLMLLGGLGGLAALRRRKRAAQ